MTPPLDLDRLEALERASGCVWARDDAVMAELQEALPHLLRIARAAHALVEHDVLVRYVLDPVEGDPRSGGYVYEFRQAAPAFFDALRAAFEGRDA